MEFLNTVLGIYLCYRERKSITSLNRHNIVHGAVLSRIPRLFQKSKTSKVFNEITLSPMASLCKDFGVFGVFGKLKTLAWLLMGDLWIFRLFWKSHMCCTETVTFPKHPDYPKHSNYY
jgi:hypothetical protein